jgi:hypothetical protein
VTQTLAHCHLTQPPAAPPPERADGITRTAHRDGGGDGHFPLRQARHLGDPDSWVMPSSSMHQLAAAKRDGRQRVPVPFFFRECGDHLIGVSHEVATPPPP